LLKAFSKIKDPAKRREILELVEKSASPEATTLLHVNESDLKPDPYRHGLPGRAAQKQQ
jgi:hypothetical protein